MDEHRQELIRSFYTATFYDTETCNVGFISEDSWIDPDFFAGFACPIEYLKEGFSPPFLNESEYVVLICPPLVAKASRNRSSCEFQARLNMWAWRICAEIDILQTTGSKNDTSSA